jgi:outer membrane protein OmpA-like peptidoglycan-associated protein/opacity protein-like surface antigen
VKKLTWLFGVTVLVLTLSVASYPMEMKGMVGLGAQGGLWKPILTDHSDIWIVGPQGGVTLKYGILKNLAIGVTGTYAYTWQAKLEGNKIEDGAGFTFSKADNASTFENIMVDLAVYYYFMPEKKFTPYVFGGGGISIWKWKKFDGTQLLSNDSMLIYQDSLVYDKTGKAFDVKDQEITALVGLGIEWYPIENLGINIGGRFHYLTHLLTSFKDDKGMVGTEKGELDLPQGIPEAFVGISYYFGKPKDTDKDGVVDKTDQCPDTPLGCLVDANGCPTDADNDGLCDGLDKCPDTPKGCKVDATGCPTDADADGVCDGLDKCADTPKGVKVDATGCPLDADADGVPDYKDKCADTPKVCKVDANGCPLDSDKDGVCDGLDKCSDTPAGIEVDASGCPKVKPIEQKITLHIAYKLGSAEIDTPNKAILDDLTERLKTYKDIKLEIGGYTDSTGTTTANKKLSQWRADKVRDYLVSKGVTKDRITSVGYGATNFVGDNKTEEGRQQNRRVEIIQK